jgi:hypothetical protein
MGRCDWKNQRQVGTLGLLGLKQTRNLDSGLGQTMGALPDIKREKFAQALLRNLVGMMPKGKAALAAAKEAGYRGSALADNARKWSNQKDVKARLVELAAPAQAQAEAALTVDLVAAKGVLSKIILANIDYNETVAPKEVINAIKTFAAIEGWNAPTTVNVNKHVHTHWTTDELVAFIADTRSSLERVGDAAAGVPDPDRVH